MSPSPPDEQRLATLALERELVDDAGLAECLTEQSRALAEEGRCLDLGDLLVEAGHVTRARWLELVAEAVGLPSQRSLQLGERFGPYEILSELGRGSMGVVYRASHVQSGAVVALKVLSPRRAMAPVERERFLREARAGARLRHPGIVRTLDAGEHQGVLWLALEEISGRSLRELLEIGSLPPRRAAKVALDVAEGLAHAHAQDVVHRDVKPDNVLIRDSDDRALLTDFGLARRPGEAELTSDGRVVGTPLYMAPEQARGEDVDPRVDVYGLGATLYEALSGSTPYSRGRSAESDEVGTDELLERVAHRSPRALRRQAPSLPPALTAVVDQALAPHPDDRYLTAQAMAEDLRRFLGGEAVQARPPGVARRARRWVARRARGLLLGGLLLALLCGGLLGAYSLSQRWRADAHLLAGVALASAGDAAGAEDELRRALELWPGLSEAWVRRGELRLAAERPGEALRAFEAALKGQPRHVAALIGRGRARLLLGDAEGALVDLHTARRLTHGADPRPSLEGGLVLYELDHPQEALDWLTEGLARARLARSRLPLDDPRRAHALLRAAELALRLEHPDQAYALLEELAGVRPLEEDGRLLLGRVHLARGAVGDALGVATALLSEGRLPTQSHLLRAGAFRLQGERKRALAELKGLSALPQARLLRGLLRVEGLAPLGRVSAAAFDLKGARADLKLALAAPSLRARQRALAALGLAYAWFLEPNPNLSAALDALDRATRLSAAPGPWLARGEVWSLKGNLPAAEESFERAEALGAPTPALARGSAAPAPSPAAPFLIGLKVDPSSLGAASGAQGAAALREGLQGSLHFQRHVERALVCYQRAQRLDPSSARAAWARACTLQLLGRSLPAISAFAEAFLLDSSLVGSFLERAAIQRVSLNRPRAALQTLAASKVPGPAAKLERARCYEALAEFSAALSALGLADPQESFSAAWLRARYDESPASAARARAALLRDSEKKAVRLPALLRAARLQRQLKAPLVTFHLLERALDASPRADVWEARARLRMGTSSHGLAFLDAVTAAELDPDRLGFALRVMRGAGPGEGGAMHHPSWHVARALVEAARGAGQETPPPPGPSTWLSEAVSGVVALRRGDLQRAKQALARAAIRAPASSVVRLWQAALRAAQGDAPRALAQLTALPPERWLVRLALAAPEFTSLSSTPAYRRWAKGAPGQGSRDGGR